MSLQDAGNTHVCCLAGSAQTIQSRPDYSIAFRSKSLKCFELFPLRSVVDGGESAPHIHLIAKTNLGTPKRSLLRQTLMPPPPPPPSITLPLQPPLPPSPSVSLQGYLAHKKQSPLLGLSEVPLYPCPPPPPRPASCKRARPCKVTQMCSYIGLVPRGRAPNRSRSE